MKKFETPEIKIDTFSVEDVITASEVVCDLDTPIG